MAVDEHDGVAEECERNGTCEVLRLFDLSLQLLTSACSHFFEPRVSISIRQLRAPLSAQAQPLKATQQARRYAAGGRGSRHHLLVRTMHVDNETHW